MNDFAIIAEGYTDQVVLRDILLGFFAESEEEPTFAFEQPPVSEARKGPHEPGGWGLVMRYLEQGKFKQALQTNRYLVVQIDTDVSVDYGVPLHQDGRELTPDELVAKVVAKFQALIGAEICQEHGHRFLFAIAVHSTECWLLPLVFQNNKRAKVTGCLEAINHERKLANKSPLSNADGSNKDPDSYRAISRGYTRRKVLLASREHQPSLSAFLFLLEQRNIQILPPPL